MKFIDHPLLLTVVFLSGCAGCTVILWIVIAGYLNNEPISWMVVAFGFFWGWGVWSSGSRLFGFKPTLYRLALEKYASKLMKLPYEEALEDAWIHSTHIPYELALRKIKPTADEWHAFEKDGIPFLLEKCEPGGGTRVTICK